MPDRINTQKTKKVLLLVSLPLTLPFLLLLLLFTASPVSAAPDAFNITVDRMFKVDANGQMHVSMSQTITNNTARYFIPSNSNGTFDIQVFKTEANQQEILDKQVATAQIFDEAGNLISFTTNKLADKAELSFTYGRNINSGQSISYRLEYDSFELTEKVGAVWNVYIPGFAQEEDFEVGEYPKSVYAINTTLEVSSSLGEVNFISPDPLSHSTESQDLIYTFSQDQLKGQEVWLQLGKSQFYKFTITQQVNTTPSGDTSNKNSYKMVLPNDMKFGGGSQKVYFTKFSPEPTYVETEGENIFAVYETSSNESKQLLVEGYAQVDVGVFDSTKVGTLSDIPEEYKQYTNATEYWEADDVLVKQKANEIKGTETNVYAISQAVYNYIVESIDYSELKKTGVNERQGAAKTLAGGASVCMEYSDLSIALLRATGVPARAAYGYGFDPKEQTNLQEGHQWTEVWMPGINDWVALDVTWGETGRTYIGADLDHFYWYVAINSPNDPPPISWQYYGDIDDTSLEDSPRFEIEATDKLPPTTALTSVDEVKGKYKKQENKFTFQADLEEVLGKMNETEKLITAGVGLSCCCVLPIIVLLVFVIRRK